MGGVNLDLSLEIMENLFSKFIDSQKMSIVIIKSIKKQLE
jgi:hypothetical protein